MSKYIPLTPLVLATATLLAACGGGAKNADTTALKSDTTLSKNLQLAGKDTTPTPQLKDVPETKAAGAPRREKRAEKTASAPARTPAPASAPAAAPAPAKPTSGDIAAGTELALTNNQKVCTNTNAAGDHLTATVQNAVTGTNGVVIPAGAVVDLTATQLQAADDPKMVFQVNSVAFGGQTYPLDATISNIAIDKIRDAQTAKDAEKVAAGAVIGGLAGKLLGKSTKGAVVGAVAGAAAGGAAAAKTGTRQGCVASGGAITIKLNSPATIKL